MLIVNKYFVGKTPLTPQARLTIYHRTPQVHLTIYHPTPPSTSYHVPPNAPTTATNANERIELDQDGDWDGTVYRGDKPEKVGRKEPQETVKLEPTIPVDPREEHSRWWGMHKRVDLDEQYDLGFS